MYNTEIIQNEIKKVIVGKDEVIEKVLVAILAGGHILLEDIPGVGKTTLALAFSKAMGLEFNRVQFTPDVVPSDITGFTMYDKNKGEFEFKKGSIFCNFFLADEINRTSSKTQSALLEVMQEGKLTVDAITYTLDKPFIVMATQNPLGTAGTQMLPEAQLDRFMVQLSMGYPDFDAQVEILKGQSSSNPLDSVKSIVSCEEILQMKEDVASIHVDDKLYKYITTLVEASRTNEYIRLGISPRGAISLCNMAKALAYVRDRNFVVPEDIDEVFIPVCRHRILLHSKAQLATVTKESVLADILKSNDAPKL